MSFESIFSVAVKQIYFSFFPSKFSLRQRASVFDHWVWVWICLSMCLSFGGTVCISVQMCVTVWECVGVCMYMTESGWTSFERFTIAEEDYCTFTIIISCSQLDRLVSPLLHSHTFLRKKGFFLTITFLKEIRWFN